MAETVQIKTSAQPNANSVRGVIPCLIGVALIFIGLLDFMLSWRAGNAVENFYMGLVMVGVIFFIVGTVRKRYVEPH